MRGKLSRSDSDDNSDFIVSRKDRFPSPGATTPKIKGRIDMDRVWGDRETTGASREYRAIYREAGSR